MYGIILAAATATAAHAARHGLGPASLNVRQVAAQHATPTAAAITSTQTPLAQPQTTPASTTPTSTASPAALPARPLISATIPQHTTTAPAATTPAPAPLAHDSYTYTGDPATDQLTIARYLTDHGYTPAAAAGVLGCIQGESAMSPEASQGSPQGGAGLIQWTPEASITAYGGHFGGNPHTDFTSQLPAILAYNQHNGDVHTLNTITDPVEAARYYSEHFERPAILDSDVRASTATTVYNTLTH